MLRQVYPVEDRCRGKNDEGDCNRWVKPEIQAYQPDGPQVEVMLEIQLWSPIRAVLCQMKISAIKWDRARSRDVGVLSRTRS